MASKTRTLQSSQVGQAFFDPNLERAKLYAEALNAIHSLTQRPPAEWDEAMVEIKRICEEVGKGAGDGK